MKKKVISMLSKIILVKSLRPNPLPVLGGEAAWQCGGECC